MANPIPDPLVQTYQALRQEFENPNGNADRCREYLIQLKIGLAENGLLDANSSNTEGLALARDVLEIGAYWSIRVGDIKSFERYIQLLQPYYTNFAAQLPASPRMYPLIGLNLLRLLSQSRIADFHAALETIDLDELRSNPFIQHPLQLEQALMEGSYKRVWNSRAEVPAPEYTFFMDILTSTIRNEIASCSEKAYTSLPLADAATLLFFSRPDDVAQFARERGWRVNPIDRKIYFGDADGTDQDLPVDTIVSQSLNYARELEKIV
ncbi:regulatory particle non-ATPase [Tieghemiomyces parasiticus]|uniref:Regulatory particle non-ATPase n=1 Tax=Tieghemiomyces parasiticus TaxID=78921 RepID=A0A9W8DHX7_9FUNG|nr:regulatory particle non-ATPase [Tieghemiomyces parasiticus]